MSGRKKISIEEAQDEVERLKILTNNRNARRQNRVVEQREFYNYINGVVTLKDRIMRMIKYDKPLFDFSSSFESSLVSLLKEYGL